VPYKFLYYYYYYFVEEMLTEHLRCLKVTAHERDPKMADEDLETRSQNEGAKQSPSPSLSPDARLRGGTLLLLLLHHRRALLLLLLLRLVFTRLLSRSVCLCLSAAADSVLKTLYTGRATR
jgi:hypothetical protein